MCNISDIMTRKVLTVAAGSDLDDAAWGLTLKGFSGAPVKDEHGSIIGILSKSDLVDPKKRDRRSDEHHTVEDAMTPLLFAALATDPVSFAVRRMVETGTHRLVVVDDGGALVGIVTSMDILRGLLDGKIDTGDFAHAT
jgi:CBS-domain-containing membrane protein